MTQQKKTAAFIWTLVILVAALGVWIWNRQQGGHTEWVGALAFSPDGSQLISAAGDDAHAEVLQWDLEKRSPLTRQEFEIGRPRWISLTSERDRVLLGCEIAGQSRDDYKPDRISLLDLATGTQIGSFDQPDISGGTLVLPQDSRLVVFGRKTIELRDVDHAKSTRLLDDPDTKISRIAVSPDGVWLAASDRGRVRLWDLMANTRLPALVADNVRLGSVAVSDDGRFVAASLYEYSPQADTFPLFFWDRQLGTKHINQVEFKRAVTQLKFLPGDEPALLVVSGKDHAECQVTMYDVSGEHLQTLHEGNAAVTSLDLSADGRHLVWVDSQHHGELWDLSGTQPTQVWEQPLISTHTVVFSPDDSLVAGFGNFKDIWLFDAASGTLRTTLQGYRASQISTYLFSILPMFLVLAGIYYVRSLFAKRRESSMKVVAQQLGWNHTSGSLPSGISNFDFFKRRPGGTFEHVLLGRDNDGPSLLAIYQWIQRSERQSLSVQEMCVIYPDFDPNLPNFGIRPESLADTVAEYIGFTDVDLDGNETLKRFSNLYVLRTEVPEQMPDVINESLAQFLIEHDGWSLEVLDGSVLLWWQRVKSFTNARFSSTDPDSVVAFVDESREIVERLKR